MKFGALQENLRRKLWERIDAGELTGLRLARQTGFQQAHVSNFLNRKRELSLDGMDRVLAAQGLSVLDLMERLEIDRYASVQADDEGEFATVAVVDVATAAGSAAIRRRDVLETVKFKKRFLGRLKADVEARRREWERFAAIRLDAKEGESMDPMLRPGSLLLIDRHHTGLDLDRKGEGNVYLVRKADGNCTVRHVESATGHLILRPRNPEYPVEVLTLRGGAAGGLVGRVCHVGNEL